MVLPTPAERLKRFRNRHSLLQSQAAEWCNTPVRTWQNWEGGSRTPPPGLWKLIAHIDKFGPLEGDATPPGVQANSPAIREHMAAFRERHGISQQEAADWCYTSLRTWQGWEIGRMPPPCIWKLLMYIDRYGHIPEVADAQYEVSTRGRG